MNPDKLPMFMVFMVSIYYIIKIITFMQYILKNIFNNNNLLLCMSNNYGD